ncbi:MAG: methyltransferase [Acidobacteria bacterium]|nr:methyltransferase [Acidobacteriota bacterium]
MTFVSGSRHHFLYFDAQLGHPPWPSLRVLDFGGSGGLLLDEPRCTVRHESYWSLDISPDAIRLGRRRFPGANFVLYDRFHPAFNPGGARGEAIPALGSFDVILAYSVFTHLWLEEIAELWAALRGMLRPNGSFAFTFLDPDYRPAARLPTNLAERLGRPATPDEQGEAMAVVDGEVVAAVDTYPPHAAQYDVLHSCAVVHRLYPDAVIKAPVFAERQHCAILSARR